MDTLEAEADKREQYSRRPNLHFRGTPEPEGERTNQLVINAIQEKMSMTQIDVTQLERSHRIGPKLYKQVRERKRPIIVRFKSEAAPRRPQHATSRPRDIHQRRSDSKTRGPVIPNEAKETKEAGGVLDVQRESHGERRGK